MWDYLGKIDPNTLVGAFTALAGLATWVYHKVKGDKQASFDDLLRGIGKQVIHVVLTDGTLSSESTLTAIKARCTAELWSLAARSGIPRNALTEAVATSIIEHTVGDILENFRATAQAQRTIDNLPTLEQVRAWFVPPVVAPLIPQEVPITKP